MSAIVHSTAEVHASAALGDGAQIWNQSQVRSGAVLGERCVVGKNVYIDFDVVIGKFCKIQNNCSVFHGAHLADGVFLGPHVVLLNDKVPRAINPDGSPKSASDWTVSGVTIGTGAAVGGNSTLLPGVKIGKWALIGSGSCVTKDVPDHALVYGNPARIRGYVDRSGKAMPRVPHAGGKFRYYSDDGTEIIASQ